MPDDVPLPILRAIQVASTTQCCTFTSDLTLVNDEYSIEATIAPITRPVGSGPVRRFGVRFLIPKAFPYAVTETIPVAPQLRWHHHQRGNWPLDVDAHANVICPPLLSDVHFDELLLPYIRHAHRWIAAALDGHLTRPDQRYEFPHIATQTAGSPQFLVEGGLTPFSFIERHGRGIATLRKIQGHDKFDAFRVTSLSPQAKVRDHDAWQSTVCQDAFGKEDEQLFSCPWFYAGDPVVEEPHRPPTRWDDLSQRSQVKILRVLADAAKLRTAQPFLLIAFAIPRTWGGQSDRIVWQCIELVGFDPHCFEQPNGFRPQKITLWPKVQRFVRENATLHWLRCHDISSSSLRSRATASSSRQPVATSIFGVGALGSMLIKSLAKAELGPICIVDSESVTPGNLVRHEAAPSDVFQPKAKVMESQCQAISRNAHVSSGVGDIVAHWHKFAEHVSKTDLIIDATGDHAVHEFVATRPEFRCKMVAWCYMTPGPDFGTLTLRRPDSRLDVQTAEQSLLATLDQQTRDQLDDPANDESCLVWPEPGCYHPTFRAPYHRVRMMADSFVTTLLDWIGQGARSDVVTLFRQRQPEGRLGFESQIIQQIIL